MRLAIIVTEFPKTTETFILRDLVEFHKRGHEVRIYHMTSFRSGEVVHGFARETLEWRRSAPYILGRKVLGALLRAKFRRPGLFLSTLGTIVRAFRREPVWLAKTLLITPKCLAFAEDMSEWGADHVHAEFATHPATCAWIAGRFAGLPYSVSCRAHDIFLTQSLLEAKLGEAAFVRTISEFNRRYLTEKVRASRNKQIAVIHSSVPVETIPALPRPASGPFRIRYLGSLEVRKGVDVLLRSLAAIDVEAGDWNCEIVGGGPERRKLEEMTAHLRLTGRVRFLGPLPFEKISGVYEDAHVVVVPSIVGPGGRTEGIPNVIMEALAYQRPVVATGVSGIPELIEDGNTGLLVPPGDDAALADALRWVMNNPDESYDMAVRGRSRVEREFNLSINAERQLDLFEGHRALSPREGAA